MTLRAKLHPTTKRERRKAFADACLMAYRMSQSPMKKSSVLEGRIVRMSNRTYSIGPRGQFIRHGIGDAAYVRTRHYQRKS